MYNNWLTIGNFTIHGYGVMIGIGILAAFFLCEKLAKKNGLDPDHVDNIIYTALIAGFISAKALYCFVNWYDFIENPTRYLFSASGWVVYGGIVGGLIGVYVYCRIKKIKFFDYLNMMVIGVALAQGFGRIGCFFAGCCYGIETTSSLGVVFPEGSLAPAGVKLLPTQLLMSWGDFFLCGILYRTYDNKKTRPYNMFLYLMLYSIGRFLVEFVRGDVERGYIGNLSTSQFIAVIVAVCSLLALLVMRNRRKKNPVEEDSDEAASEEETAENKDAESSEEETEEAAEESVDDIGGSDDETSMSEKETGEPETEEKELTEE